MEPKKTPTPSSDIDWDKELAELHALTDDTPVKKAPPKRLNTIPEPKKPIRRPAYRSGEQYDHPMEEKEGFFSAHKGIAIFLCILVLLGVFVAAFLMIFPKLASLAKTEPRIGRNVTLGSLDLSRMTTQEAEDAIAQEIETALETSDLVVHLGNGDLVLTPDQINASLDIPNLVQAMLSGSQDEYSLLPYLELDMGYIRSQLDAHAQASGSQFRQSSYRLEGEQPALEASAYPESVPAQVLVLDPGAPGLGLNVETLMQQILDALDRGSFQVEAQSITVQRQPDTLDLDAIHSAVSIDPQPGVYGYTFDPVAAKELLLSSPEGEVRIPMEYISPLPANVGGQFPDVLGKHEAAHRAEPNRLHNLQLYCQALNGVILQPGEVLSVIELIGTPTKERGYLNATLFGHESDAVPVGGGIQEVATVLYYCAMISDLEIVQRVNYDYLLGYTGPGMDADIDWRNRDLKIRNNTSAPIQILAETTEDHLTIQILGTDTKDYYVQIDYQQTTYPAGVEYQTVYEGSDGQVLQTGNDGAFIQTYRCRYSKRTNELLSREPEAGSNYPMTPTIIASLQAPPAPEVPAPSEPEVQE